MLVIAIYLWFQIQICFLCSHIRVCAVTGFPNVTFIFQSKTNIFASLDRELWPLDGVKLNHRAKVILIKSYRLDITHIYSQPTSCLLYLNGEPWSDG